MNQAWFYLGCHNVAGHYLFQERMRPAPPYDQLLRKLNGFDGRLAPQDTSEGYIAVVTRLGGWDMTALSWWDYTIDKRPGSNSTVFAPGLEITPTEILEGLRDRFSAVWARQPQIAIRP